MGQSLSQWSQQRNTEALSELAPLKTPGSDAPLPRLDRDTLLEALQKVAAAIAKRRSSVTVVAVGGAVNTIYLRSRETTHDVDFFNVYLGSEDVENIILGARDATKRNKSLGEGWFNNRTILFIPNDQRQALTDEAYAQNEIIFQEPGLTVLAAPWNYAFCCKVDRISGKGSDERKYDLEDAVQYLDRYLRSVKKDQIARDAVKAWFARFSLRWTAETDAVLVRVSQAYASCFEVDHAAVIM
ncbi:hypothetical protein E4U41_002678 [Claviceps citrina]|nr:hypothetical protein E4U41_002678 [Claviceps citrina]